MIQSPGSTAQRPPHHTTYAPLSILRTETVLSRFPIHNLTTKGDVTIHITQTNAEGERDLRWAVSYNAYYGPPRHLAYKLDTIVINQRLDTLPRPLPRVLKLGSLRQIGTMLNVQASGRQHAHLTRAFHQNASAYIVAKLRYRGRDGTERRLEAGFTRYSVIFTGEPLPDGTPADAVYLVLSEPYREVLTHAPTRPLDYAYLKGLAPMAQRCYEIVSYKMFAALKYHHPHATLRYADYCLLSTQQRYTVYDQVKKQMYKVHQPHVLSGYLTKVHYEGTTDADGQPDWLLHYTPGAKAWAEYAAFMRQPGAEAAAAALASPAEDGQEDLAATVLRESPAATPPLRPEVNTPPVVAPEDRDQAARPDPRPATTPGTAHVAALEAGTPADAPPADALLASAQALVDAFYQRFHGLAQVTASPKELDHAMQLLTEHGEAKAYFLLAYAHQAAPATHYHPQTFMGILHYLSHALAAYDARATQATQTTTQQAAATERRWQERYLAWRQQALAQLRNALPPTELEALEDAQQARLVAGGTPVCAQGLAVRLAVDAALEAQAGLPPFDAWRQTQEDA